MPKGDRTGPQGRGPLTGRKDGHCAGYDVPGFMNDDGPRGLQERQGPQAPGHGQRRGPRRGRNRRGQVGGYTVPVTTAPAPLNREEEISYLKGYAEQMAADLETVKERLQEIESGDND